MTARRRCSPNAWTPGSAAPNYVETPPPLPPTRLGLRSGHLEEGEALATSFMVEELTVYPAGPGASISLYIPRNFKVWAQGKILGVPGAKGW
jgi:hypothetical protein